MLNMFAVLLLHHFMRGKHVQLTELDVPSKLMMYSVGDQVRLHTHDSWNDLYGIIENVLGELIVVFCVTMPMYRYYVWRNEANIVLELMS